MFDWRKKIQAQEIPCVKLRKQGKCSVLLGICMGAKTSLKTDA